MNDLIGSSIFTVLLNLISNFLVVVLGILFTQFGLRRWDKRKYGRWHVIIKKQGEIKVDRAIPVQKAKEILDEPADLSVFLKGVVSPYSHLNCDIIEEGESIGLLIRDNVNRQFIVDLDKNPPCEEPGGQAAL